MQQPNIMPKYQVEKIETPVIVGRQKWVQGKGFETERLEVTGGYMVYFPQGHSIFVESDEKLAALNLDDEPRLVDLTTGEEVPEEFMSVKRLVETKTSRRRAH